MTTTTQRVGSAPSLSSTKRVITVGAVASSGATLGGDTWGGSWGGFGGTLGRTWANSWRNITNSVSATEASPSENTTKRVTGI